MRAPLAQPGSSLISELCPLDPPLYTVNYIPRGGLVPTRIHLRDSFPRKGIGLNEQRKLGKDDAGVYTALSLTSSIFRDDEVSLARYSLERMCTNG